LHVGTNISKINNSSGRSAILLLALENC